MKYDYESEYYHERTLLGIDEPDEQSDINLFYQY